MDRNEIVFKINSVLSDEFEKDASLMEPEADIFETLDLDSLDLVDLVVLIERNFGVVVKGHDLKNVKTFNDFYDFLNCKING